MLDDLKYIHQKDSADALGIISKQASQLSQELDQFGDKQSDQPIQNIVYAAMGGSALAAHLSTSWPGWSIPFSIWRDYGLPRHVDQNTLVVVASYSGNTEETLSALEAAEKAGASIAVITGGGKLLDLSREKNYTTVILPKFAQPRFAVLANLRALLEIAEVYSIANLQELLPQMQSTVQSVNNKIDSWSADTPTDKNYAKQLAHECTGLTPVIYSSTIVSPTAYKWKIGFNENGKNVAWQGTYPEFNHNEFIGWSSHPIEKPYRIITLRSSLDNPRIHRRMEISEKLLSGKWPMPITIDLEGVSLLEQLVWSMILGDLVSTYVGLLNGIDPAPVELVEKLKKELAA